MKKELEVDELIDFSKKMGWDNVDFYNIIEHYFKEKFYLDSCKAKTAPKDKVFNLITFKFDCELSPDRKGDIGICYDDYCIFTGVYWELQLEEAIPLEKVKQIIEVNEKNKTIYRRTLNKYYRWKYDITEAIV